MKKKQPPSSAADRRQRAEERLRSQRPKTGTDLPNADTQRLVHELQVHQIELEMQNEELQQARDKAEELLERYSDLYDFAPAGYLTLDRAATILEANLAAANLLGIERSRLLTRPFKLHLSATDLPVFDTFLARVFESKAKEICELTLLKESKHAVEVRMEAMCAASGQECRVAVTDITEWKQAEEEHLVLSKLESTGILAGGIAHDFNNLLTVILLNLELAESLIAPGGELAHFLERAKQAGLVSKDLTHQLLTFAKGGAPIREPIGLSKVIRNSARLALSGSPIRCDFSLVHDLRPVEADAGQMEQVIRNLVLNARESMPQGGVVSVRAENVVLGSHESPSLPPGDYIRVSITDQGAGISKEMLSKIFDPYFSTKQKDYHKGVGLGLTICHTIIQKHGGAMSVESEPGVGTTFYLYLPESRNPLRKEEAFAQVSSPRHGRILVMDDEEGVRELVGKSLRLMGHEVELVADGQQAVEVYESSTDQRHPFDVVILDLTVRAGIGGKEAIQELLRIDPEVKAIVMSGYATDPVLMAPERYGFKGVLAKPFDFVKLQQILSSVMKG